ncbi:hypothetical protein D9M72_623540 [compost metagenome]
MGDAMAVQVFGHRGNARGNAQRHGHTEAQVVGVGVTAARRQARQSGEVAVTRCDQLHHQPGGLLRVIDNPPFDADQVRVQAGGDAGVHLVQR